MAERVAWLALYEAGMTQQYDGHGIGSLIGIIDPKSTPG